MNKAEQENLTQDKIDETNEFPPELKQPRWSVISFEKCEAGSLTYSQAEQKIAELDRQKIPGLCIVTDEAALRILRNQPRTEAKKTKVKR